MPPSMRFFLTKMVSTTNSCLGFWGSLVQMWRSKSGRGFVDFSPANTHIHTECSVISIDMHVDALNYNMIFHIY